MRPTRIREFKMKKWIKIIPVAVFAMTLFVSCGSGGLHGTYVACNNAARQNYFAKFKFQPEEEYSFFDKVFKKNTVKVYMGVMGIAMPMAYEYRYSLKGNKLILEAGVPGIDAGSVEFTYNREKDEISLNIDAAFDILGGLVSQIGNTSGKKVDSKDASNALKEFVGDEATPKWNKSGNCETIKLSQNDEILTVTISIKENDGNGKIRVGGNYTNVNQISIRCINHCDNNEFQDVCQFNDGKWWYDKPVEAGIKYTFEVRAYNNNGEEKREKITVTAKQGFWDKINPFNDPCKKKDDDKLGQEKPRITSPSDRSTSVHGSQLNVTVSGSNIEVIYTGLNGNPNPSKENESDDGFYKGTMNPAGGNKFFFTPNTPVWKNKWVKIIAHDKNTDLWSDPIYVKILGVSPPSQPEPVQGKPRITSPEDRSTSVHGNQLIVSVEGSSIEVKYVGLKGEPDKYNTNESDPDYSFYNGFMNPSGNNTFYFTPNTPIWKNKWVKIIAHIKNTNIWSEPKYVMIQGESPQAPRPDQRMDGFEIPADGGALKHKTTGEIREIYIPVSILNRMTEDIKGRAGTLKWSFPTLPDADWDAIANQISYAAASASVVAGASGIATPAAPIIFAVGEGIASAIIIYDNVSTALDVSDEIINSFIEGWNGKGAKKIVEYATDKSNRYVVIPIQNTFASVTCKKDNIVKDMNGIDYEMKSLNNLTSSDVLSIDKVLNNYKFSISSVKSNNQSGNINTNNANARDNTNQQQLRSDKTVSLLNQIVSAPSLYEIHNILVENKKTGKVAYGTMDKLTEPEKAYFIVYKKTGEIIAILDKGSIDKRKDLLTGEMKGKEILEQNQVIWFQLY